MKEDQCNLKIKGSSRVVQRSGLQKGLQVLTPGQIFVVGDLHWVPSTQIGGPELADQRINSERVKEGEKRTENETVMMMMMVVM